MCGPSQEAYLVAGEVNGVVHLQVADGRSILQRQRDAMVLIELLLVAQDVSVEPWQTVLDILEVAQGGRKATEVTPRTCDNRHAGWLLWTVSSCWLCELDCLVEGLKG